MAYIGHVLKGHSSNKIFAAVGREISRKKQEEVSRSSSSKVNVNLYSAHSWSISKALRYGP